MTTPRDDGFLVSGGAMAGPFGEDLVEALDRDEGLPLGSPVGPYRLVEELGRGGMAVVYLAERADGAFVQQVALKIVKRGLDTDEVISRFRQERQILAALAHDNIARLLDGGVAPDGRPYLAMELVRGEPVDRYCDRLGLAIGARVDLCIAVARAVEHAHRRLVVHRDLKPSNILIGADGAIKLLDFGIAKLLAPGPDDFAAPATRTALRLMTPEYASPEQVRGDTVTTASDVYQLGLILFELVTGRRAHGVSGMSTAEAERVVCETPAPRPSTAVVGRDAAAERRRRELRGDLDNIIGMALAKEPDRRYGSMAQLADDLTRYRQGRPVLARGRSWSYRAGKFLARHRIPVAAAALVLAALASIVTFYSLRLAAERDRAQREALTATAVADFVAGLFRASDPQQGGGANLTAREILARGAARIDGDLATEPEVRTRLMDVMGGIYRSLGLTQEAIPLLERALDARRGELGPDHADVGESHASLGLVLYNAGRLDEARRHLDEAIRILGSAPGPRRPTLATALSALGLLHRREGRLEEARDTLHQALATSDAVLGPSHQTTATVLNNLGLTQQSLGDRDSARASLTRALAIHESNHGPDHPFVGGTLSNLSDVMREQGDLEGARPLVERAVSIAEKAYGPEHRDTGTAVNSLGSILLALDDFDGARGAFERAAAIYTKALGPGHAYVAYPYANLGDVDRESGRLEQAVSNYQRSLEIREAAFGPVHRDVSVSLERLGTTLARMGECAAAVPVLERALDVTRKTMPPDHSRMGLVGSALGACLAASERVEEAERALL
ncbi:MAG: tetratricopeptide repeat protein, partial [Vicinamibacterales bacterium]